MTTPARWLAGVIAALVVIGVSATALQQHPAPPAAAVAAPVVATTVACPGLRSRAGYTTSTVAAATPPRTSDTPVEPGRAAVQTLTANGKNGKRLITLTRPGQRGTYVGRSGERDAVVGQGLGSLAPGFSVTQTERTVDGNQRGLASTQCLPTGADFWFVGAGSDVGQRPTLVLSNPEDATASVDVDMYGRRGPLSAPAARGVQVPARSTKELSLQRIVPGEPVLAVHVRVTSGRLSAALTETDVNGLAPRGTDWIPNTLEPATSVLVAGFPPVASGRTGRSVLSIAAPGTSDAMVSLSLLSPDGSFTPSGQAVIDVHAGGVTNVDLTKELRGQPATVVLKSTEPIVAGARVLLQRPHAYGDTLFLAAATPLTQAAVVPDNSTTKDLATRLVMSAPQGQASVDIFAFDGARTSHRPLTIAAGSTRVVTVTNPGKGGGFGIVVTPTPGSAPVVGVRFLDEEGSRGPLVTATPLLPARLTAVVRPAVPDITTGLAP